ncbi:MAG: 50S ribosomal protein L6 [Candidatus Absconditabacteria bacterium]
MSRIGKAPIDIVAGVEVKHDATTVEVKGPKGTLSFNYPSGVVIKIENNQIIVTVESEEQNNLWGLSRTLISNLVEGVTKGYEKKLKLIGVGYNARLKGNDLVLNLGYSHPIEYHLPSGISASIEKDPKGNDIITISGIDKQLVGQTAAKLRTFRLPEPYKGKGVRYIDEVVKMKAGKTSKK